MKHLFHVFPTFAIGGSQARFVALATAHGGRYRHTVLSLDGVVDAAARIPAEVPFALLDLRFDKRRGLGNLPLFRRTLARQRPDLLVTYNWGAIEWALANRFWPLAPHVHIEDGFGPEERERRLARRIWLRRLALSGRRTTIVVPSRTLERIALREWRMPSGRVLFIPNGIDFDRFAAAASPPRGSPTVVIGTLATLRPEKNLARLIRAFASLDAAGPRGLLELVIAGDGPERPSLEATASSCGVEHRVRFTGATDTPEVALAAMDIFALSSDTEQMPLSILEAMASGLPIVAFAVGDILEMVSEPNRRYVFPAAAEADFRAALALLATDPGLRRTLGQANQRTVRERFGRDLMVARYAALYG